MLADGTYAPRKVGITAGIKIHKNKTAPEPQLLPSKNYHFEFDIYFLEHQDENGLVYGRGVDVVKDYVDTGIRLGVIKQKSSWFSFANINENGAVNLIKAVRANPAVMGQIRDEVFGIFNSKLEAPPAIEKV